MGHRSNRHMVGTLVGALISCSAAASPHAPAAGSAPFLAWGIALASLAAAAAMGLWSYRMCAYMRAAMAEAEATEERFTQATRHSRTVVWEVTVDGLYTFVSPAAKDVLGYAPEDLVGKKHVWDLHPEEGREVLRNEALRGMKARESFVDYPNQMVRADGVVITVASSAFPIYHPDGSLRCYRGTDTDITEKIEAEAAARESLTQLRHAMDATSDGIWDWNLLSGEIHLTPRVYEMLGYEPGEICFTSENWGDSMHPDDRAAAEQAVHDELAGKVGKVETRMRCKDGSYRWLLSRGKLVETLDDGTPARMVGTLVDITERKQAEAALAESESRFRRLFELGLVGIVIAGVDRRLLHVNERMCEILGRSEAELHQMDWGEMSHPDDLAEEMQNYERLLSGDLNEYQMEKRYFRPDGQEVFVQLSASCIRDESGAVTECIGFIEDITERKRAVEALASSEERFRTMFELGLIGMAINTPDHRALLINDALCEITGYERDELAAIGWLEITHPDDLEEDLAQYEALLRGDIDQYQLDKRIIRKDQRIAYVSISVRCVRAADGTPDHILSLVQDITAQREAQTALTKNEKLLRYAMDATSDGIWEWNPATGEFELSPRLYELLGHEPGAFLMTTESWLGIVHPDDRASALQTLQALLAVESGKGHTEYRVVRTDGEVLWAQARGKVVERDADGTPTRVVGTITDITERKSAQQALEASDALFEKLTGNVPGVIFQYRMWPDGRSAFPYISDGVRELYGLAPADVREDATPMIERVHPDDQERILESVRQSADTLSVWAQEFRVVVTDHGERWVYSRSRPEPGEDGSVIWYGYITDVTEQKRTQAALEASDKLFASLTANVPGVIYQFQVWPDGKAIVPFASEGIRHLYDASVDELRENAWVMVDRVHPEDKDRVIQAIQRSFATLEVWTEEFRTVTSKGVRWLHGRSRPEAMDDGSVLWHGYINDITERKAAQAAVEARDALFESLTAYVPGAIYQLQMWPDGNLAFQYVSEGARDLYEVDPQAVIGDTTVIFERTHPDDLEMMMQSILESYQNLTVWSLEFRILTPTHGVRWMQGRSRPERQADGSVMWYGYTTDITERKQAEEEARLREERAQRQRAALAHLATSDAIATGDLDRAKQLVAETAARTIEVERASLWRLNENGTELVCFELFELNSGAHSEGTVLRSEDYLPYFDAILKDGRVVAHEAETDPATTCFAESYLRPLGITSMLDAGYFLEGHLSGVVCLEHIGEPRHWRADEESFVTTLAALTGQLLSSAKRKEAEEALAAREATFAKLSANVPGFLFQYQMWPDGRAAFPFASEGIRATYEISPEVVRNDASYVWDEIGHPDDVRQIRESVLESMRTGAVWSETFRVILATRGVRWMRGQARPEAQPDGSTIWHGYISDITEQVEAYEERRELEQQFERTQRLESLGVMAGGIAHDFNNILMAVLANAEIVQRELPADSPALHPLSEIHVAADRAAELCRQMLAYAGKSSMVSEKVHMGPLVEELSKLLRASMSKKVHLEIDDDDRAPAVEGDASQIGQVVMNLIINGAEAMDGQGGTVTVRIRAITLHEGESMRMGFDEVLPPGSYALVEVIDDGSGMDAATRARIFEPFFTTKFTGRGLGLAAVLGIVRSHNGALAVTTRPGEGTHFRVLFPAAAEQPSRTLEAPSEPTNDRFRWEGGVLLVDDESPLRMVGQRMLEKMGCRVWTAEDGIDGLKKYDQHAHEIDLVILDLTMPNMDGHETLVELRKRDRDLPVIIASGFTAEDLASRFEGQSVAGTLQKPFGYQKLEAALRAFVARHQRA